MGSGTTGQIRRHNCIFTEGQFVTEGQKLYRINSTAAEEAVYTAEASPTAGRSWMAKKRHDLPSPPLQDVSEFEVGDTVSKSTKVATLVDDTRLKLTLFFSYACKDAIYVGQPAQVSLLPHVLLREVEKID